MAILRHRPLVPSQTRQFSTSQDLLLENVIEYLYSNAVLEDMKIQPSVKKLLANHCYNCSLRNSGSYVLLSNTKIDQILDMSMVGTKYYQKKLPKCISL